MQNKIKYGSAGEGGGERVTKRERAAKQSGNNDNKIYCCNEGRSQTWI